MLMRDESERTCRVCPGEMCGVFADGSTVRSVPSKGVTGESRGEATCARARVFLEETIRSLQQP